MPHLGDDLKAIADPKKGLAKLSAIVCRVHLNEANQHVLDRPLARQRLLDPVASDCKVRVGVTGLPCVTCEANFAFDSGALIYCSTCVSVCEDG
jgi:hypothetical protein